MADQGHRSAHWCFTWHDHCIDDVNIPVSHYKYLVMGNELCPTTNRAHVQGYVSFNVRKKFTTVKNYFDQTVHLTVARGSPQSNKKYCSEDGDWVESGDINSIDWEGGASGGLQKAKNANLAYQEALAASTVYEGLKIIQSKRARDYCLHGESIERNLKRSKVPSFQSKYSLTDFNCPSLVLSKTVLLHGPSNTGKTSFALSHFRNPLLVRHIERLKQLSPDNDGIVFDDMSFKHWPSEAVIHLLDTDLDSDINVRYTTVCIPAKVIKIFTHNDPNPFYSESISLEQQNAIERRLLRVHVHNKLYS